MESHEPAMPMHTMAGGAAVGSTGGASLGLDDDAMVCCAIRRLRILLPLDTGSKISTRDARVRWLVVVCLGEQRWASTKFLALPVMQPLPSVALCCPARGSQHRRTKPRPASITNPKSKFSNFQHRHSIYIWSLHICITAIKIIKHSFFTVSSSSSGTIRCIQFYCSLPSTCRVSIHPSSSLYPAQHLFPRMNKNEKRKGNKLASSKTFFRSSCRL